MLLQQIPGGSSSRQQQQRRRQQAEREQPVGQPFPSTASADPLAAGAGVPRAADHAERTHQEEARGAEGKLQVSEDCRTKGLACLCK